MASTRSALEKIQNQLDESMGVRQQDSKPVLSPVPNARDVGRRALRTFGTLSIDNVMPDPDQPRVEFTDDEIERLAASIRDKGQLHPIRVRWSESFQKWIIISGERRYRATKHAGLPSIQCHFTEGELSKTEVLEQQLIENLLREDLKPIEEAKALQELLTLNGWSGKELSEAIRVSASRITRALALLKLPPDIQQRIESGEVAPSVAYEISKLPSDEQRRSALEQAQNGQLTREEAQSQVRQRSGRPKPKSRSIKQSFTAENGWKVTVSSRRSGTYEQVAEALQQALDEVNLRIHNNIQLL